MSCANIKQLTEYGSFISMTAFIKGFALVRTVKNDLCTLNLKKKKYSE